MIVSSFVNLPLDADGFLRRECPSCEREFKWHHGPTDDAPSDYVYPDLFRCPLCGTAAGSDSWWTPAQLEHVQQAAAGAVHDQLDDIFRRTFKPSRNSFVQVKVSSGQRPNDPDDMVEQDDMAMIAPPCHPWEPVKVPHDAVAPFYCLLCGTSYAV